MNLELNNLHRLICYKTQIHKQTSFPYHLSVCVFNQQSTGLSGNHVELEKFYKIFFQSAHEKQIESIFISVLSIWDMYFGHYFFHS